MDWLNFNAAWTSTGKGGLVDSNTALNVLHEQGQEERRLEHLHLEIHSGVARPAAVLASFSTRTRLRDLPRVCYVVGVS